MLYTPLSIMYTIWSILCSTSHCGVNYIVLNVSYIIHTVYYLYPYCILIYITYTAHYVIHNVYYMINTVYYCITHRTDEIVLLYLGFAVATPWAVRVLLNETFKRAKSFLNFSLEESSTFTYYITNNYKMANRFICTFLRSFSAALISDFMVLSNLLRSFGFFFLAVGKDVIDDSMRS